MSKRIDIYLVENKYFSSRSHAQDAIKEQRVYVNGKIVKKASLLVEDEIQIEVEEKENEFASRAGNKLYGAITSFDIDLRDKVVLDIGASTGGFSDVCLKEGARFVYAIDAGKDQLIQRLRNDERVKCIENFNCRYLEKGMFDKKIDFVCMDVSFISIKLICESLFPILEAPYECVFLIKPQFEAGKAWIGKNGIVKDKKIHKKIMEDYIMYFKDKKIGIKNIMKSSTVGRDGNQEYLIYLCNIENNKVFDLNKII